MNENILARLKEKLDQYNLWDVAKGFYNDYEKDVCLELFQRFDFKGIRYRLMIALKR